MINNIFKGVMGIFSSSKKIKELEAKVKELETDNEQPKRATGQQGWPHG